MPAWRFRHCDEAPIQQDRQGVTRRTAESRNAECIDYKSTRTERRFCCGPLLSGTLDTRDNLRRSLKLFMEHALIAVPCKIRASSIYKCRPSPPWGAWSGEHGEDWRRDHEVGVGFEPPRVPPW
ncbi:hypothetical protein KC321_g45 [Hortaea werneckii]|nr:hypothetical protein KC321_g45 [Hortaea werneckii]